METQKEIVNAYENACNGLAELMAKTFFNGSDWYWVGDEIGGVADFGDIDFLTPSEMKEILEKNVKYDEYAEWRDATVENAKRGGAINLHAWLNGVRYEMLGKED